MATRRAFLTILGSTAVILAAGGTGFHLTRDPIKARAPWAAAGGPQYTDPRMRALSFALLAPNPHNKQPWAVDLSVADEVTLYCDLNRLLPETDPPNRQITIGFGAFLELLRLAAAEDGFHAEIVPFPGGMPEGNLDQRPIARILFSRADPPETDDLFGYVLERRTNRAPFDLERPVAPSDADTILGAARLAHLKGAILESDAIDTFRQFTWDAHIRELTSPKAWQESVDAMRIGKAEIEANPDGIALQGTFLEVLALTGILSREQMADPKSQAFKQGLAMFEPVFRSAMGYLWIATESNTRLDQLGAGADWLRMQLAATKLGISLHPLSQALQEFPEMNDLYTDIHARLGLTGKTLQMFGRIGYAPPAKAAPRWPLEARILRA